MIKPTCGAPPPSRPKCTMRSGCTMRTPDFTVAPNSVDRLMRLRAGSTAENPPLRSGSQFAAALTAPRRHDRTSRPGPHAQAKAVHTGPPAVVRLKRALALGHDALLAVSRSSSPSHSATLRLSRLRVGRGWFLLAGRRGPQHIQVAAVSPTFGRLFEGTDVPSLGQTWPVPTYPLECAGSAGAPGVRHRHRPLTSRTGPKPPNQLDWNGAERLAAARKTVSFCQGHFKLERRSTTKRGWRIN